MKHLILTLDYELYGDGSGNVFEHIIKPTERILTIAEAYNARLTIFFEVIEYWRLKEQWYNGNHMGYAENPITAIEEQLRDAYARGHDIQLHLHPQWVNAYWHDNHWIVDNSCWRLSVLPQVEIAELLKKGKQTIENILGADEFHCNVFRAGGYNIQPSENVVKAMQSSGFIADTSIYPCGTGISIFHSSTNAILRQTSSIRSRSLPSSFNKLSNKNRPTKSTKKRTLPHVQPKTRIFLQNVLIFFTTAGIR